MIALVVSLESVNEVESEGIEKSEFKASSTSQFAIVGELPLSILGVGCS